jgi:hypothetical protein
MPTHQWRLQGVAARPDRPIGLSTATPRPGWSTARPTLASHRGCAWSRRQPTRPALAQRQPRPPLPGRSRAARASWRARTSAPRRLPGLGRHPHLGSPPRCSNRASRWASRRSVLTRPPGGRSSLDGATTTQPTPAAWSARASPNPVGPASSATPTGPGSDPTQRTTASVAAGNRRDHTCPVAVSSTRPGSTGQPPPGPPTDALPPSRAPPSLPLDRPSGANPRHPPSEAPAPKRARAAGRGEVGLEASTAV